MDTCALFCVLLKEHYDDDDKCSLSCRFCFAVSCFSLPLPNSLSERTELDEMGERCKGGKSVTSERDKHFCPRGADGSDQLSRPSQQHRLHLSSSSIPVPSLSLTLHNIPSMPPAQIAKPHPVQQSCVICCIRGRALSCFISPSPFSDPSAIYADHQRCAKGNGE